MQRKPESDDVERLLHGLPIARAPEALWRDVQAELDEPRARHPLGVLRRPIRSPWLTAAAAVLALLGGSVSGLLRSYAAPSSWSVSTLAGAPSVGGMALTQPAELAVGEWLVTNDSSRARLEVGRIGTAEVGPGSSLRLDPGGLTAHRLTLERGSLRAVITAPPRLFFVETPAALATDLGCAYTMEVDSLGSTRLHVTAGWVELQSDAAVSVVPAGLVAEVAVGEVPGTPFPVELATTAQDALHRLDAGTGSAADLALVLDAQYGPSDFVTLRQRSAVTLWHLVQRVGVGQRAAVYERLAGLSPPPRGVTREGILRLDRPMLERWRRELSPMWSDEAQNWVTRLGRRLWERVF